jgi:protein-disulfide isomerase
MPLVDTPLDVAFSSSGKWIYVLTDKGAVQIYDMNGKLHDTLSVGTDVNRIEAGPREEILILLSTGKKTVQQIMLDFIQEIDITGSPFKGRADAPVAVVLFTDFQCPYCARVVPLLEQVLAKYPEQVRLVLKQFPLRNHQYAQRAAIAVLAAHKQGKSWEMQDLLFKQSKQLNDEKVLEMVRQLNLDEVQFKKDWNDPSTAAAVNRDVRDGYNAGVRGTPTIFVNGRLLRKRSLEGFSELIEKELLKGKK